MVYPSNIKLLQWETKYPCVMIEQGIIELGVASGCISSIISEALIFDSLRKWVATKSKFFGNLIKCGWCVSVWVAMFLEIIYQPNLFHKVVVIDEILTGFIIAYLSGLAWLLITGLMTLMNK